MSEETIMSPLAGLARLREARSLRVSSWDKKGGNEDYLVIPSGKTATLADVAGPGCIRHIWITVRSNEKHFLRKLVLRCWWDGEAEPSVEVPLGDFFGCGHARLAHFNSLPLSVIMKQGGTDLRGGMNCWFPMPFAKRARITIENECATPIEAFYYYVDYEKYDSLDESLGRFHAWFNVQKPAKAVKHPAGTPEMKEINLTGKQNHLIVDARGRGHYVGCVLSVLNWNAYHQNHGWFGEGDDMFFIDGEKWPPSLHGTGTEDYFCAAWGFPSGAYSGPYTGVTIAGELNKWSGMWSLYRFHVEDPVHFRTSLRFGIEHGHANDQGNDYASVGYWYQVEPHQPFAPLASVAEREPRW